MSDISGSDIFDAASVDTSPEPAPTPATPEPSAPPAIAQPDAQPTATTAPATPPADPAASPQEPTVINEQGNRVPLSELLEQRERRQAAERKAEEAERRYQELERQLRQSQQPRTPPPDVLENPQAFAGHLEQSMEQRFRGMMVNMSFDMVRESNPNGFQAAWSALQDQVRSGNSRVRDEIVSSPNPGSALMRWHQREETIRQIGDGGLEAYRQRMLDEAMKDPNFRTRAMEAWRTEAQQTQTSASSPPPSIPSLNRTTGVANPPERSSVSGAELFEAASAPRRR